MISVGPMGPYVHKLSISEWSGHVPSRFSVSVFVLLMPKDIFFNIKQLSLSTYKV
jgi:hypothetical protein